MFKVDIDNDVKLIYTFDKFKITKEAEIKQFDDKV